MSTAPDPITPLSNAAHIRSRPGMYIGGLNQRGLAFMIHFAIEGQLDLSHDQLSRVQVTLMSDGFYQLDCIGAIADIQPQHFIEFLNTDDGNSGIDLPVIAAFSDPIEVEIIRDGERWKQRFIAGVALEPPAKDRIDRPSALHLRYRPDPTLFKDITLSYFQLCGQIQELAIFHPETTFHIEDQRTTTTSRQYHYPEGLLSHAEEMEYDFISSHFDPSPFHFEISEGPNHTQAILIPTHFAPYVIRSYANGRRTPDGGTHVQAFESAFKSIASQFRDQDGYPFRWGDDGDDPFYGLTVLLSVDVEELVFDRSTRSRLGGQLPAKLVTRMINEQLPPLLSKLCKK